MRGGETTLALQRPIISQESALDAREHRHVQYLGPAEAACTASGAAMAPCTVRILLTSAVASAANTRAVS